MTAIRKFTVYGTVTPGTTIKVLVDGDVCKDGPVESDEIFSFYTGVDLHGKVNVSINVVSGKLVLGLTTVTYPAIINNVAGYVNFEQPIKYPMLDLNLNELKSIMLLSDESINYYHITLNGPDYWQVTVDAGIEPGTNLDIGNITTNQVSSFMKPIFNYTPLPCSAKDPADLEALKSRILAELI